MNRFTNNKSPLKRGFRNGLIMAIVVGGIVYFQGETFFDSVMTFLTSFAFIFPALWLSYHFTQKIALKYQIAEEKKHALYKVIIGQSAPNFSIKNQLQEIRTLESYSDKNIVLYFYPKDDTPGCTIEAKEFSELKEEFSKANTSVVGISKDTAETHQEFIKKFNLNIELLADTQGEMCNDYHVWQEKEKDGKKKMGILRSTFIINTDNEIFYVEYGVSPEGHAQAILNKIKDLQIKDLQKDSLSTPP